MLTLGIFIVSIISYGLVYYVDHGWQYVQGFSAIPSIIMLVMKDSVPESPKWLLSNDSSTANKEQISTLLTRLRPSGYNVEEEIGVLVQEAHTDSQSEASWEEVFRWKKAVIIGVGLMFFQAATGINSVVFYSSSIFQLAGFSQAIIGTVCWTIVNVIMTVVSAKLVDKAGRKVLLLSGTAGM
jgi:SP family galactose:H+ symporter-like MFS transporter